MKRTRTLAPATSAGLPPSKRVRTLNAVDGPAATTARRARTLEPGTVGEANLKSQSSTRTPVDLEAGPRETLAQVLATSKGMPSVRGRQRSPSLSSSGSSSDDVGVKPAALRMRVLGKRSKRRLARYIAKWQGETDADMSYLEAQTITGNTLSQYSNEKDGYEKWTRLPAWKSVSEIDLDVDLVKFITHLFFQGHDSSKGYKLLASIMFHDPRYSKAGIRKLPRAWRAMKGWHKLCPSVSKAPHAFPVFCAFANYFVQIKETAVGLFMMMSLSSYGRPGSMLRLQPEFIIKPCRFTQGRFAIILDPLEKGKPGKTGEYDNAIILDQPWIMALNPLIMVLAGMPSGRSVWRFDYPHLLARVKEASKALGVPMVPYQTRHSGASLDQLMQFRSLADTKKRGVWKQDKSVARYEKRARVAQTWQKLPLRFQQHAESCEYRLTDIMVHGRTVPYGNRC